MFNIDAYNPEFIKNKIRLGYGVGGSEYEGSDTNPQVSGDEQSIGNSQQEDRLKNELNNLPALTSSQYSSDGSDKEDQKKGIFGNALDFAEKNPVLTRGLLNAAVNYIGSGGNVGAGLYGLAGGVAKGFSEQQEMRTELRKINQEYKNAIGREAIQTQNQASIEGLKLSNILERNKQELVDKKEFDDYQLVNKSRLIKDQLEKENLSADYRHALNKQLALIKAQINKNQTDYAAKVGILADSQKTVNRLVFAQQFSGESKPANFFTKDELSVIPKEALVTVSDGAGGKIQLVKNPKRLSQEDQLKINAMVKSVSGYNDLINNIESGKKTGNDIRKAVAPFGLSRIIGDKKTRAILELGVEIPARALSGAVISESEKPVFNSIFAIDPLDDDKTILWKLKRGRDMYKDVVTAAKYGAQFQTGGDGRLSLTGKEATDIAKKYINEAKKDGITKTIPIKKTLSNGQEVKLKQRVKK